MFKFIILVYHNLYSDKFFKKERRKGGRREGRRKGGINQKKKKKRTIRVEEETRGKVLPENACGEALQSERG